MGSHFDNEELSMSLSSPPNRHVAPDSSSIAQVSRTQAQPTKATSDLPREGKVEQRIGQYSVQRTLGEGSFGKVKLAVHRISGQEVALKIISRKKLISRDMAGRVEREIQYLQLLRHPHIIKLYTVITTPNEIIMVLEYAGGELFDYIVKHGKMSEDKARRFFQQIVCAVEYCHRHKIVHRDLKPENLLLDKDLNVKIADFGLSNIMTDGNFLKTSCGSPNYAAPEVISGKLYAGPEVDVWSCGIILYVLLVGRLPFDDDFIPALFRKINSGTYYTPSYLTSGARHIIHKMLKVNAVQRITIQEIRQDPWFNENLEDYLKPSADEFIDTGVDPNKAIDPRKLAPGKSAAVQEQIHQSVIGKLGKTMGYAKDDVQEALGKDEPNAIKDAYLIVRENQIMRDNPALTTPLNTQPFLATSPPAWDAKMPSSPLQHSSPLALAQKNVASRVSHQSPIAEPMQPPSEQTNGLAGSIDSESKDNYASKISILTSSVPFYHNQFMDQKKKDRAAKVQESSKSQPKMPPKETDANATARLAALSLDNNPVQSPEEQAETARRLKPNSLSSLQLQYITSQPVTEASGEGNKEAKKPHRTRWQFGIRSRNMPHDAMHCVYKALKAQGAEWEVPFLPNGIPEQPPKSYPVHVHGATKLNETMHPSRSGSPENDRSSSKKAAYSSNERQQDITVESGRDSQSNGIARNRQPPKLSDKGMETDDEDVDPHKSPENYIPKDPWCIRARWRKDGMYPAGALSSSSTHSSRQDLHQEQGRRVSMISTATSGTASSASMTTVSEYAAQTKSETSCYVYLDVQLYTLEMASPEKGGGTFLVDFKSAGYEPLVEKSVSESEKVLIGSGYRIANKDVTSPQPFLDMSNKLVIFLAGGTSDAR